MSDSLTHAPHVKMVFDRLIEQGSDTLLITEDGEVSANQVLDLTNLLAAKILSAGVVAGSVCAFEGDFGPNTIAVFLALAKIGAIAVPFTAALNAERRELEALAQVEWWIDPLTGQAIPVGEEEALAEKHKLTQQLVASGHPGLIVFTSGSTGKPKAILHDVDRVASKFKKIRRGWRTVLFLLMDHFGGFNTLFAILANKGIGICLKDRSPEAICRAVQIGKADLLPTTPTFLGFLSASGVWRKYDLSSIQLVTYGAEPMPPATLARVRNMLPKADFKQTYGLSELGVLRSSSPDQASLWLKIGGDGFETRIVDDVLHIRSSSAMLGYLNAESAIDSDGWMNTGDLVEEKDGLIRFMGRRSEFINVGGQKVLPSEIEDILTEADGVACAVVSAVPHVLLGQAIVARVALMNAEDPKELSERLKAHCRARLQKYKIPMRFEIVEYDKLATVRAKKNRSVDPMTPENEGLAE